MWSFRTALYWFAFTLPSTGTSGPCHQNAPHSIAEPPDPLTVGVKHSGLRCSLGVHHTCIHPLVKNMVKVDSSDHITVFHFSVQVDLEMCIHLCNEGFMQCIPTMTSLCNCWQAFFADIAWSFLHWHHSQTPEEAALSFSLRIALMHEHHGHQMWAVDQNLQPHLLTSFT